MGSDSVAVERDGLTRLRRRSRSACRATAKLPTACSARVTVLKLQLGGGDAARDAAAGGGDVVAARCGSTKYLLPVAASQPGAAVVHAAVDRAERRVGGAVGVDAAVARRADAAAAEVAGVGARRRRCTLQPEVTHGAGRGHARRRVADRCRAVAGIGLALRVGRARAAGVGVDAPHSLPGLGAGAIGAGAVAVAGLADPLVADVAGAVDRIGGALGVGGAAAAVVGLGDGAELAGRAVGRRPVAVAGDAAPRHADGRGAVRGIDAAGGVAAARGAAARGADVVAGAVRRDPALARDAEPGDAEVRPGRARRGSSGRWCNRRTGRSPCCRPDRRCRSRRCRGTSRRRRHRSTQRWFGAVARRRRSGALAVGRAGVAGVGPDVAEPARAGTRCDVRHTPGMQAPFSHRWPGPSWRAPAIGSPVQPRHWYVVAVADVAGGAHRGVAARSGDAAAADADVRSGPYFAAAWQVASVVQATQVKAAVSQTRPPMQSPVARQSPLMQVLVTQRWLAP